MAKAIEDFKARIEEYKKDCKVCIKHKKIVYAATTNGNSIPNGVPTDDDSVYINYEPSE